MIDGARRPNRRPSRRMRHILYPRCAPPGLLLASQEAASMTPTSRFRGLTHAVLARAGLAALLAGLAASPGFAANNLSVTSLSNRPDKISGGDVLVRIDVPSGVALGDVKVQLNGRDATSQFRPDPSGHALLGLVTGLELGQNQIQASAKKASTGKLKLV